MVTEALRETMATAVETGRAEMSQWEAALLERVEQLVSSGRPQMVEQTARIPAENYYSPERLALERQNVFSKFPLLVGFSSQIPNPGDFLTHDRAGVPLLLTRDREGVLHAFLNVCRHRGLKVAEPACGSGRANFVCRYHGWSYDLDGKLSGVPLPYGFPDLDRAASGLVSLPVAELYGLIFVRTWPGPALDLREYLAPLRHDFEAFGLGDHVIFQSSNRVVQGNWKLMLDANLEGYHVPVLHRASGALAFHPYVVVHDGWDPHARFLLPLKGGFPGYPAAQDAHRGIRNHAGVLYVIFPNTLVFFLMRTVHVLTTFPIDADRSLVQGFTLVEKGPVDEAGEQFLQASYDWYWTTIFEDIEAVESIQAAVRSGANREFITGRYEFGLERFHSALEAACRPGSAPRRAAGEQEETS
jgi:phenylpropionate dioxygenase-like ring-hydroxylating dioxygenase large terminal subunit